jgi:predicted  nucleic acid-binding Zn-ribbon protein
MNVQHHSAANDVDLDSTAELPVLDIAEPEPEERLTSTDTWIVSPPTLRIATEGNEVSNKDVVPLISEARPHAPAHDARPQASVHEARPHAATFDARSELETNLRALSANLGDVEDRLKRKVEQLAENERALVEVRSERDTAAHRTEQLAQELTQANAAIARARAEIGELERSLQQETTAAAQAARDAAAALERAQHERATSAETTRKHDEQFATRLAEHTQKLAGVQLELDETRARAANYLESLQTHEGRRNLLHNMFSGLQSDLDAGAVRITALEGELGGRNSRLRELESELDARAQRIARLEKDVNTFTASLAQRDKQLLESDGLIATLRRDVAALNEAVTTGTELIRKLEEAAARNADSASSRDTELGRTVRERDQLRASVISLESAIATAAKVREDQEKSVREARSRSEELEAQAAAQRKRSDQIDTELQSVRTEMERVSASLVQAMSERSEHVATVTAREERIKELEARFEDQQDMVRTLQADTNAAVARAKELESDLRAAEEAIHRLESDVRAKSVRVDELEQTKNEWNLRVNEARSALTEKEALIQRLEAEAANSSVLIGQIQQSMKRLDPSSSGTHEALPEGATRLLIRAEGESEVVHVLGRKTTIGRTPDNDLQIDAKFISRHHAVILAGPARTIVEDLNSTNGVLVNSRRVTRQVLQDGDSVVIGRTQFRFAIRQPAERRG